MNTAPTTLPPSIVYTYLLKKRSKKYLATREDIRIFTIMDDKELEEIGMTREEWDSVTIRKYKKL
jgi:hypothetical protein